VDAGGGGGVGDRLAHHSFLLQRTKFDPRHHNTVISEKQLNKRKYKKEMKSAIKEVRRDNEFISRVQFKETMEK
jgi:hypothetical protein